MDDAPICERIVHPDGTMTTYVKPFCYWAIWNVTKKPVNPNPPPPPRRP